jgi:formylglycine-generating enzyme required for sulfatase activity
LISLVVVLLSPAYGVALLSSNSDGCALATTGQPQDSAKPTTFVEKLPNSTVEFKMVHVPGGKVRIGEKEVTVKSFMMGATEVTWDVFDGYILSGEPSKPYDQSEFPPDAIARPSRPYILPDLGWGHAGYPVINVSATTVEMFLRWLRSVTGKKYRLATEAEWQLAASAANDAPMKDREWFSENAKDVSHPVGKKLPNSYGLYDMLGNVGEWCADTGGKPVLCGGDFTYSAADLKPTVRRYWAPEWQVTDPQIPKSRWWLSDGWFVGFRLVCDP